MNQSGDSPLVALIAFNLCSALAVRNDLLQLLNPLLDLREDEIGNAVAGGNHELSGRVLETRVNSLLGLVLERLRDLEALLFEATG